MLKRLFGKKSGRVAVLGVDGVPFTLFERFASEGLMPNLAAIAREGTLCPMDASIPEISSTSWSTFMTGVNPGRHGIYGFMELQDGEYSWRFPNFTDLRSKTLWEIAGEKGKRCIVMNIPSTYPARPLNGMLVSGFVALDLKRASYPDSMFQYLSGMGYRLDVDTKKAASSMSEFTDDIMRTFRKRAEAVLHLLKTEDWDLFVAAVTETDRLHHYLWAALADPSHPQHGFFLDFYRELDGFIGEFRDSKGDGTAFVMLSDHGFTAIKKEVYLNVYLREKGYLSFGRPDPASFEEMEGGSRAFVLDPSRVYIHTKGRYRRGGVGEAEYEDLRARLREDLLSLEVDGEKAIREVIYREDLYSGPCYAASPDMVLLSNEGYDLKASLNKTSVSGMGNLTGGHTRGNAVFFIDRKISCGKPEIADAGATVLSLLGIDTGGLDGKPLA